VSHVENKYKLIFYNQKIIKLKNFLELSSYNRIAYSNYGTKIFKKSQILFEQTDNQIYTFVLADFYFFK